MTLSVAIITKNEEANIRRTLESVRWANEIILVDSGSTDRTCDIARELGAKVFVEDWKGFAAQKNSAIEKCTGDWILSLDADEEVSAELAQDIRNKSNEKPDLAYFVPRRNLFLGRWIKHGGFYPDPKLRLFRRGKGRFENRAVHETVQVEGELGKLRADLIHHAYPTLSSYIEHMNSYSSLGAEMAVQQGKCRFSIFEYRYPSAGDVHLQLLLAPGISGWTRRPAASPLPLGLCELEIREGVGKIESDS